MIISIDTDLMHSMSGYADCVNEEIDTCMTYLSKVVEHNDWNCKERDAINDSITEVKMESRRLKEKVEEFANIIRQIADRFNMFENSAITQTQNLEVLLGSSLAVTTGESPAAKGQLSAIAGSMSDKVTATDRMSNYTIANLTGDVQVCEYSTINSRADSTKVSETDIQAIVDKILMRETQNG